MIIKISFAGQAFQQVNATSDVEKPDSKITIYEITIQIEELFIFGSKEERQSLIQA